MVKQLNKIEIVRKVIGLCSLLYILSYSSVDAQRQSYPGDYFMFPINPGGINSLAGVLGDLRTNHFHGGIDVRTQQREGLPVYAAADGYVSKVAVQGVGYGNVIFLKHPNGMTTVYGHLQSFKEPLAAFVREAQYKSKSFTVELFPVPGAISFKKGEVIALSGNTGSSAGPHLHFEIRDRADNYLNPLFFGFKEIKDSAPPYFVNVALRPMDINSRVNGQFERKVVKAVRQRDGSYRLPQPITGRGSLGLELQAYDAMSGTGFRYGLYCIDIKVDDREIFAYNMEQFPNGSTRDYNNLIDYKTDQATGVRFYRCYNPEGNAFNLYETDQYRGQIQVPDTLEHEVKVKIYDSFQNSATLIFTIKGEVSYGDMPVFATNRSPDWLEMEESRNVVKVLARGFESVSPFANYLVNRSRVQVAPAYYAGSNAVFLTDLRHYLPDSVKIGTKSLELNYLARIPSGSTVSYPFDKGQIQFDSTSLFDTLNLRVRTNYNSLIVNDEYTALKDYVTIRFKPQDPIVNSDRIRVYRFGKGDYRYIGGSWEGNQITFRTRELGLFTLQEDSIPPRVRIIEQSKNRISATISDDRSGIDKFELLVNGEWVLMNYEYKKQYIWSEKLDSRLPFEGEFTLKVTDKTGNSTILQDVIKEPVIRPKSRRK